MIKPTLDLNLVNEGDPLNPALLGHYDLSGALYQFESVPGLIDSMLMTGFSEWRIGAGRWEAATLMLPTLTNGSPCIFPIGQAYAPTGTSMLDLLQSRDWFIDDGTPVSLSDIQSDERYQLTTIRGAIDTALAFGARPFVSIDLMPRALASNREPFQHDCVWTFANQVSNIPPADVNLFAAAVVGLVKRVVEGDAIHAGRPVTHWEIWNEPEAPFFWDPEFDPMFEKFFPMALTCLVQLDAYRSQSGSTGQNLKFGMASFLEAESAANIIEALDITPLPDGSHVPMDFISFHSYSNDASMILSGIQRVTDAVKNSEHYQHLEVVLAEWGPDLSLTSGDLAYAHSMQPPLLMSRIIAQGASMGLDRAHHTIFWDYFEDNAITWGLLDHEMNAKPLYRAYQLLAAVIGDGSNSLTTLEESELPRGISYLASIDQNQDKRVLIINAETVPVEAHLRFGARVKTPSRLLIFDSPNQPIRTVNPQWGFFTVPPQSLVLAEFQAENNIQRETTIPENAVKMTPETDTYPPVIHSTEWSSPIPMSGPINTAGVEDAPVITSDGNTFIFFFTPDGNLPPQEQILDEVTGVWWCKWNGTNWTKPIRADLCNEGELHLDGPFAVQGNTLWFGSIRAGNYRDIDIYTAKLSIGEWLSWRNAGEQINLEFSVGENYLSADGNSMYFGKTGGGFGQNDLWLTEKDGASWSQPVNLGAPVNSANDESRPFISSDGSELWFTRMVSGKGYHGPAIFRSIKIGEIWSEPEEIVSNYVGDPGLDDNGNLYFTHLFFDNEGNKIEADIYVATHR